MRHFIKIPFINKGIDFIDLPSLNRPYQIILKIKNRFLFVINITRLLEVQYSISINWLLILILIQRLQIHETEKFKILSSTSRPYYYRKYENYFRFKTLFYYLKRAKI